MRPSRSALVAIPAGGAFAVAIAVLALRPAPHPARVAPTVGHRAPDFAAASVSGARVSLSGQRGHPVLLNFFTTWCVPCRREMPLIRRSARAHPGLHVLAVDRNEPASVVRSFANHLGLGFAPLLDPDLAISARYRVSVQPVSFWIDRNGTVRAIDYTLDSGLIARRLRELRS